MKRIQIILFFLATTNAILISQVEPIDSCLITQHDAKQRGQTLNNILESSQTKTHERIIKSLEEKYLVSFNEKKHDLEIELQSNPLQPWMIKITNLQGETLFLQTGCGKDQVSMAISTKNWQENDCLIVLWLDRERYEVKFSR